MANKGFPVYQDYEYELSEEELAEPDFYVDRYFSDMMDMEDSGMGEGGLAPFSVSEILEHCIEPTLTDGLKHMGKIIVWCVIFRTVTQVSRVPAWLCHLTSVVTGAVVAMHFFGAGVLYILPLVVLGYIVIAASRSVRGPAAAAFILTYNLVCETWIADTVSWHMIRGAVMIVAMKIISLGFDMDTADTDKEKEKLREAEMAAAEEIEKMEEKSKQNKNSGARNRVNKKRKVSEDLQTSDIPEEAMDKLDLTKLPGILEFFGYCLCPGTIVLGPWVSYEEYINIYKDPKWNFTWLIKIIFTVLFAFMFLTIR